MRRAISLLLLSVLAAPALADDAAKAPVHHGRQTWQEHFAQANVAHDGHLKLEEAKDGFPLIAKHFDEVDADHKGYVTEDNVRAWRIMRRAARRLAHPPADPLAPQPAFQLRAASDPAASAVRTASVPARVPPAPRAKPVSE